MGKRKQLNGREVKACASIDGKYAVGGGLYLIVKLPMQRYYVRYMWDGKRRDQPIGDFTALTLTEAQSERDRIKGAVAAGVDPYPKKAALSVPDSGPTGPTFREATDRAFELEKRKLKGEGVNGRWRSPLDLHVMPKLGDCRVADIRARDITAALEPIWLTKPETARKALDRITKVMKQWEADAELDLPRAQGLKEMAQKQLGAQTDKAVHIPSMPYSEVPAFYATLDDFASHLVMRMIILTALRATPVRMARVEHFDFENDIWTVPGELMKDSEPFGVPLTPEVRSIAAMAVEHSTNGYLFSHSQGKPLSDVAMLRVLDKRGIPYRPHGFRASFKTWVQECGIAGDEETSEIQLAHKFGNKVRSAYARSDQIEKRRDLMGRWEKHVTDAK